MAEDKEIDSLLLNTANILLASLKEKCDKLTMDMACNILAAWSSKFVVATMKAAIMSFKGISEEHRKKIMMYLLVVFNTMFWEAMRNFVDLSDEELIALKKLSYDPPKMTVQ